MRELIASPSVNLLDVDRLDETAVASLIGDMLALSPAPSDLVEMVMRNSEGNPFFATEYLRAAVDEGCLNRDRFGRWTLKHPRHGSRGRWDLPLPRTLADLVRRRLARLDADARLLAELAAVFGRESDAELLRRAAGLDAVDWLSAVNALLTGRIIEETAPGRLSFAHDKLREVIYDDTADIKRQALHRNAAAQLERIYRQRSDNEHLVPMLAYHWDRGRIWRSAVDYLEKAGEGALRHAAYREAVSFFTRAIEIRDRGDVRQHDVEE